MKLPDPLLEVIFKEDEDGNHLYSIDGHDTYLTGVTTILKTVLAKQALVPWASKMVAEAFAYKVKDYKKPPTAYELQAIIEWAKKAPVRARDTAGDFGTEVHGIADLIVLGKEYKEPTDERVKKAVANFKGWLASSKLEIVGGDTAIASEKFQFGGRFDAIAVNPKGEYIVLDFKTSKGVYGEHFFQVGAYAIGIEEVYGVKPVNSLILHIRPEGVVEHWNPDHALSKESFILVKKLYENLPKFNGR